MAPNSIPGHSYCHSVAKEDVSSTLKICLPRKAVGIMCGDKTCRKSCCDELAALRHQKSCQYRMIILPNQIGIPYWWTKPKSQRRSKKTDQSNWNTKNKNIFNLKQELLNIELKAAVPWSDSEGY